MRVEYRLLGPLEADVDGRQARLGGPKQRAVLALLLCQPNTVVPASRLIDGLWGDAPPGSAANLVQGYVSGLRKALGKEAIETRGAAYVLRVSSGALDLQRFERLAYEGSQALERDDPSGAAAACGRRSRSGEDRRSRTSRTSRRSSRRSRGSTSCACTLWSAGSRPISLSAATRTSSVSSRAARGEHPLRERTRRC